MPLKSVGNFSAIMSSEEECYWSLDTPVSQEFREPLLFCSWARNHGFLAAHERTLVVCVDYKQFHHQTVQACTAVQLIHMQTDVRSLDVEQYCVYWLCWKFLHQECPWMPRYRLSFVPPRPQCLQWPWVFWICLGQLCTGIHHHYCLFHR